MTTATPTPAPFTFHKTDELAGVNIAISGGGIGGAASALAATLRGANVTLFERHREFREVGAGLQIGPHGWRMLQHWGVLDRIVAEGFLPENMKFRDALTGEDLLTLDFGEEFQTRYRGRYVVIHRSDLLNTLLEAAAEAGATLHTGVIVEDARTVGEGADQGVELDLTWRDDPEGPATFRADIMLALDGIHSIMRAKIVDDEPVPSAYVAYRGTSPLPSDPVMKGLRDVVGYIGPHCHFIQYPLRSGELLNQVGVFQSDRYLDGRDKGEIPEDWGNPDELATAYDDCIDLVKGSIDKFWKDQWWQMSDREPLLTWVNGRTIVMGDAAHPPLQYLASGAVMAMEDAECFAAFAAEAADKAGGPDKVDWDAVLHEVEAERAPRAARIQTTGRFWGELWHLPGTSRLVRNELFRAADRDGWFRYADWLWDYEPTRREYIKDPTKGQLPKEIRDWKYTLVQRSVHDVKPI